MIGRVLAALALGAFAMQARAQDVEARLADLRLATAVEVALATDADTRRLNVEVMAQDGVVVLSGEAGSGGDRTHAEEVARAVEGVREVIIRLEGESPPSDLLDAEDAEEQGGEEPASDTAPSEEPADAEEAEPADPEPPRSASTYHVVQAGDTLYNIARRYATTVEAIQRLNGLRSTEIALGQRLRVR
ncbi:MAG TPA: LysM peptidoglycan-binding domain-containing protein [Rubricoccaceae bacterium]|nr:LysM peptidoglycan-binding domain-containing protein [Rubricoccaceae bacterium]